ncbi:MAG: SAM-dependent methyltransferase [Opitutaceae bacterium]
MKRLFTAIPNAIKDPHLVIPKLIHKCLPRRFAAAWRNHRILDEDFGQRSTFDRGECLDGAGQETPWYTYPAIEYLRQLDFSNLAVFEFGSGNSTIYWAKRCERLASVENDQAWYEKMKGKLPAKVSYRYEPDPAAYVATCGSYGTKFDVIVIDGRHRFECAKAALSCLRSTGFIILDNSDWHERSSKLLRDADLIEVDFSGFGPVNDYTWTTSFYFTRSVQLKPAGVRQPMHGIGGQYYPED